ncbi:hypothetical protein ABIE54_005370 [Chitinophagaceae bacterium OAS944]
MMAILDKYKLAKEFSKGMVQIIFCLGPKA